MIEIVRLQKIIHQRTVLDIPDLRIEAGEIIALVGPIASGKEVLFDLLIGRTKPSAGRVRAAGIDPRADQDTFSQRVGVMFSHDGLYANLSPLENLRFFCRIQGLPMMRADEVLEQIGLADQGRLKLSSLPESHLRRLTFGRTILHRPSDLLLMEPLARCDEPTITLLSRLLRLEAEAGRAILVLADDATHLAEVCDHLYLMQHGQVLAAPLTVQDPSAIQAFKIPVRLEGKVALVNPGDVYFAEAKDGRVVLVMAEARLETHFTLSDLERRLARSGFFRAHRSYLVNLQHIKEVIPFTRNSYNLRLDDAAGTRIPLSKKAAAELRELLGF